MEPGQLVRPMSLAVDPCGWTIVADLLGSRLQAFDRLGRVRAWWAPDGLPYAAFGRVTGLAAGPAGTTLVAGGDAGLQWLDRTGRVVAISDALRLADGARLLPGSIAADEQGAVYAIDETRRAIVKLR
jgi:hypothetical protein